MEPNPIALRSAEPADAAAMCALLNALIAEGGNTAHRTPFDEDRMTRHYISPQLGISCTVALEGADVVGFQALERADPDWPGDDSLTEGWAVIASFVAQGRQGRGIGKHLFATTLAAAKAAGIRHIDATIRRENSGGRAFYDRLGFTDYRESDETVSKKYDVEPDR